MNLNTVTEPKKLTTDEDQLKALKSLKAYVNSDDLTKKQCQKVAHDLFDVASSNHETAVSDNVLDNLKQYYISNVALLYEVEDNKITFDDSTDLDNKRFFNAKKLINSCKQKSLDPNDYWIEETAGGGLMSVSQSTLKDLLKNLFIENYD